MKLKSISLVHKAIIYCRLGAATMAPGVQQDETQKAAPEAAGRNDPLGASGIASSGQVGLKYADQLADLLEQVERNRDAWHSLAVAYLAALGETRILLEEIRKIRRRPKLEQELEELEGRLTQILDGPMWRLSLEETEQEEYELSRKCADVWLRYRRLGRRKA